VLLHATAQSSRWLVPAQADQDNAPERVGGLAVAAIQAMASLSTGEGIKRRGATAGGEGSGSLRAQPAGIATGGHPEGTDHVRTDAELSEERRRALNEPTSDQADPIRYHADPPVIFEGISQRTEPALRPGTSQVGERQRQCAR
jgi:hypothetical protein